MIEREIYRQRFSEEETRRSRALWVPICRYLERWIPEGAAVLDIGAGPCHFINQVRAASRIAVDINGESLERHAAAGVRKVVASGAGLGAIEDTSIDVAFASNVYEHFPSREDVARSLREVHRVLRPGGGFLILQPNFACCARTYYDFFDHRLAFTHKGMAEGLEISGFEMERVVARFLPYTTKGRLPQAPWLVALYLRMPPLWRLLGAQMLLVARKPLALRDDLDL